MNRIPSTIRPAALAVTLSLMAACSAPTPPPTPSMILAQSPVPPQSEASNPDSATTVLQQGAVTRLVDPAPVVPVPPPSVRQQGGAEPNPRIDASTPEALVASLQSIETQVSPRRLEALKAALTVMQMRAALRYKQIALRDPRAANFSDAQLFEIAFGDVDGRTVLDVIAEGERILPTVVDERGNPL